MSDRYLTIAETSELLRCSQTTVRRAIRAGRLRVVRIAPRTVRVDAESISIRKRFPSPTAN